MPSLPFQEETSKEIQLDYQGFLKPCSKVIQKKENAVRKVERDSPQKQVNVPTLPF